MKKKIVGQVTVEEKDEILRLFERRNGLNELAKIIQADNEELYEKMIRDLGVTSTKFQQWWDRMVEKYQWESSTNGRWEIDVSNCNILLCE